MERTCRHCGEILPPPHAGRGKQKRFCSDNCRVKFAYRQQHPDKATNKVRHGPVPKLALRAVRKAWLAALLDGEGYIGLARRQKRSGERHYYFPIVQIFNCNVALVERIAALLGDAAKVERRELTNTGYKPIHRIKIRRVAMEKFLKVLQPYLVAKTRQAEIVRAFCRVSDNCYVREYPESLYEQMWTEMRDLNKRGT